MTEEDAIALQTTVNEILALAVKKQSDAGRADQRGVALEPRRRRTRDGSAESVHDGVELRAGGTWGRLGSRCDDISAAGKGSDVRRCSIAAE
jgi:hypothetical protein